jgi:radical SAM superfamily enzyme YgiQ (UPF0313 family)
MATDMKTVNMTHENTSVTKVLVLNPPFLDKFSRPQRSPAVTKSGTLYFPIWLAFCVGVLEDAGHEVRFIDAPASDTSLDSVLREAESFAPSLIVMDTSTPSIENDTRVAGELKKVVPSSFVVLVGTHVSAVPEETLRLGAAVDAVARREYEYTVRELADLIAVSAMEDKPAGEDLKGIAGLSVKVNGDIVHNGERPFIEDLDALPWVSKVYKKHLDIRNYFNPNALFPMVTLITSRGCPFKCSFCVYPQTFTGHKYRHRSVADVIDEIEYVTREIPEAKSIFLEDDTLTVNKTRCGEFADALVSRGISIPWVANSRVGLDLETMQKMKASGCLQLCVGFESGDNDVLKTMRKGITTERMFQFCNDARKAGIVIHGCFMVGFPGETPEQMNKTIALSKKLDPDTVQFYPVMVYPGTHAYEQYKAEGWITAENYRAWLTEDGLHNCVIQNEYCDSKELVRICDSARRQFYLRPRYLIYKAFRTLRHPSEFVRTAKAARVFLKHLIFGSHV